MFEFLPRRLKFLQFKTMCFKIQKAQWVLFLLLCKYAFSNIIVNKLNLQDQNPNMLAFLFTWFKMLSSSIKYYVLFPKEISFISFDGQLRTQRHPKCESWLPRQCSSSSSPPAPSSPASYSAAARRPEPEPDNSITRIWRIFNYNFVDFYGCHG